MLRCWKKKRNPPLDRDPACEGMLIKYYVRYKHNKDNVDYEHNKDYVKSRFPSVFRARIKAFRYTIKKKTRRFAMEEKKYEMVKDDFIELDDNIKAYRIRLLRDIDSDKGLMKGTIGGYVEHERNLSQEGMCWIAGDAVVHGGARVMNDAVVANNAEVYGDASVNDRAFIGGNAQIHGNAAVYDGAQVYGHAKVYGRAQVKGYSRVYHEAEICGEAVILDKARVYGDASVFGKAKVMGQAEVYEDSMVFGRSRIEDHAQVYGRASVHDYGRISGNAKVKDSAFVYQSAHVTGWACVSGQAAISNNALVMGDASVCGNAMVYGDSEVWGEAYITDDASVKNSKISGSARIEEDASICDSAVRGHAIVRGSALVCNNSVVDFYHDIKYGVIDGRFSDMMKMRESMDRGSGEIVIGEKGLDYLKSLSAIHSSFDESRGYMARDMRKDIEAGKTLEQIAEEYKKSIIENTEGDYQKYELSVLNGLMDGIKKAEGIALQPDNEPVRKYEMTDEKKIYRFEDYYTELRRIRAMRDIPEHGVKKGDMGGWIESEENLSQEGCCWIGDEATVCANAKVEHGAIVRGHAAVVGDAWVQDKAIVDGYAVVSEGAWIKDEAVVKDFAIVQGWARVRDKGMVYDNACVSGETEVFGEGRVYQSVRLLDTEMVDYDIVQRNNKRQADNTKSAEKVPPKKRVVVKKNTSKKPKTRS